MSERKFKIQVTEDELKALISLNAQKLMHANQSGLYIAPNYSVEITSRIHDLTKRLNRETPEIETDNTADNTTQEPKAAQAAASSQW